MNKIFSAVATTVFAVALCGSMQAQDHRDDHRDDHHDDHHDNGHYVQHKEWKRGYHMDHNDWNRGERVDYRQYHLSQPRPGYEWRRVDGNFVMAAVATGVIASLVAAH